MLLAPARGSRPHDVGTPPAPSGCPFCPGNEARTPPETMALRPLGGAANGPGWLLRAFPNKFPALAPGEGAHEVIVSTPRHVTRVDQLTDGEMARAVRGWRARLGAVAADPRGLWPFLFLNEGAAAGASLQHAHAQLVGLPFAPPRLVARERAFEESPACPLCEDLARAGERLVDARDGLAAWCPAVPPLSGTVRLAPVRHAPDWDAALDPDALGRALRRLAVAVAERMGGPALNLWLHQRRPGGSPRFHWHVDLVPRLGTLAGLELGAGVIAVAAAPEATAARLRGAQRGTCSAGAGRAMPATR